MSDLGDYGDEMTRKRLPDDVVDALLEGRAGRDDPDLADVAGLVDRLRSLSRLPADEQVASRHLAEIVEVAGSSPTASVPPVVSVGPGNGPIARRRIMFGGLLSGLLAKLLAAAVALAAVGTVGYAADQAVPGDALYGLDTALERIGIGAGGVEERIEEARALVERGDVPATTEAVRGALDELAERTEGEAADALRDAAAEVGGVRNEDVEAYAETQELRDHAASLVETIADQVAAGQVDGPAIAEQAREFAGIARELAADRSEGGSEGEAPPGSVPEVTTPDTAVDDEDVADEATEGAGDEAEVPETTVPETTVPDTTVPDTTAPPGGGDRP